MRHLAASNFSAGQLDEAAAVAARLGVAGFVACQDEYSLLSRGLEETLAPAMERLGLGLVPYFPLAGGALTGKYRKGRTMPEGARLSGDSGRSGRFLTPNWERIETLAAFAETRGHTLLDLAMSWLARRPLVVSIIAGATRPEQLDDNSRAVGWDSSADDMAEIERLAA